MAAIKKKTLRFLATTLSLSASVMLGLGVTLWANAEPGEKESSNSNVITTVGADVGAESVLSYFTAKFNTQ